MSRAQLIKKVIGEAIEEFGFVYEGYSRDEYCHIYTFVRKKRVIKQYIWIETQPSLSEGGVVKLSFMSSANSMKAVQGAYLIESDFERESDGLVFKTEEELTQILYLFNDVIRQKGLDILQKIRRSGGKAAPKKRTQWKLYQEHEGLNEEYRKKYGLEETESTTGLMQKIYDVILENKDRKFAEVEELLVGLAAVYGDQIVRKCGGQWKWYSEHNSCMIEGIFGSRAENPLLTVISQWRYWKYRDIECLIREFRKNRFDEVD